MHKDLIPKKKTYPKKTSNTPSVTETSKKMVRCALCGRAIAFDVAYCVVEGPRKTFYCSREEYEGGMEYVAKRLKYENGIEDLVRQILNCDGFDVGGYNTALTLWLKEASYKKIYYYLFENEEDLRIKISERGISTNTNKLKYLSAIIMREIVNYKPRSEKELVSLDTTTSHVDYTNYVPKLTPRKGLRRSMEELEDEYGEDYDTI